MVDDPTPLPPESTVDSDSFCEILKLFDLARPKMGPPSVSEQEAVDAASASGTEDRQGRLLEAEALEV